MDRWEGKVAIVTGASAGIGAAIAEALTKAGILVVGLARRLDKMEKLSTELSNAKGKFYARQCDVREEEDLLGAFKWVESELGGVDILVNNVGISKASRIIDDDIASFRTILETNVLAMAICIRQAVTSMKRRQVRGHIININSVTGHYLVLDHSKSLYPPSKFAVTALTETVRKELAEDVNNKIKITSISPGRVKTGMMRTAGASDAVVFETAPYLEISDVIDAVLYVLATRDNAQVTELTIRPAHDTL